HLRAVPRRARRGYGATVPGMGMRILLVHQGYPPAAVGGSEIYVEALARQVARDHEVAVLYPIPESDRPKICRGGEGGVRLFGVSRSAEGFESYRDPAVAAAAESVLDEFRPELVHVHHLNGLSTGVVFAARERGAAVV